MSFAPTLTAGAREDPAVERHAPGLDQPLDLPPRGDTGAGEALGDALAARACRLTDRRAGCSWVGMIDHDLAMMRIAPEQAQAD